MKTSNVLPASLKPYISVAQVKVNMAWCDTDIMVAEGAAEFCLHVMPAEVSKTTAVLALSPEPTCSLHSDEGVGDTDCIVHELVCICLPSGSILIILGFAVPALRWHRLPTSSRHCLTLAARSLRAGNL